MKKFSDKLESDKVSVVRTLTKLQKHSQVVRTLDLDIDYEVNDYEKGIHKPYFVQADVQFDDFATCFDFELQDYGLPEDFEGVYKPDDDSSLIRQRGGHRQGALFLKLVNELPRQPSVTLQGSITGDGMDIDDYQSRTVGVFEFEGLSLAEARTAKLSQQLILDAYSYEREGHRKAAFLTYFMALEALVTESLQPVVAGLVSELHDALEHLQLDAKMKVAAKHAIGTADVKAAVPVWGPLMQKLRTTKDSRNQIVHGKSARDVAKDELNDVFACIAVFAAIVQFRLVDEDRIGQHYFPKRRTRK